MSNNDETRKRAEEVLKDSWPVIERDRHFTENPSAQEVYGSSFVEDVEHIVYPVKVDEHGKPFIEKRLPVKLFAALYPSLGDESMEVEERFEEAIERAWRAELDTNGVDTNISKQPVQATEIREEHVEILKGTRQRIFEA